MTCAEAAGGVGASVVLLNPDLGMKVALGIHQKDRWAAFVRSFASGPVQKSTSASTMRGREILVSAQACIPLFQLVRVRAAKLSADRARARAIYPFRAVGGLPRDPAARRVQRGFEAVRSALRRRGRAADALPASVRRRRAALARRARARNEARGEAGEGPTGCVGTIFEWLCLGLVLSTRALPGPHRLVHRELDVQLDERRSRRILEEYDARVDLRYRRGRQLRSA
jgi:hypothetical protein